MPRTLLGLQAARGVAALLVVLYHGERALALPQYVGHASWAGLTRFGHAGVDFFFVLSGFIISWVHGADLGQPAALPRYAARRAARIYPPYWAATALLLAVAAASHGLAALPGAGALLPILLLAPGGPPPPLGVAWTLVHETEFYLLFGLAIWRPSLGLAAALACAALDWMPLPPGLEPLRAWGATWFDALFPVGIAAAWAARHAPCRRPGALALGGAALFLLAGFAENAGLLPPDGWPGRLAYGLPAATAIVGLVQSERAGRLRVPPALALLGAASYSVYLVHSPVLGYAARAMAASGLLTRIPDALAMALAASIAIAAGLVFHRWVERPLTAAAARLLDRAGRPAPLLTFDDAMAGARPIMPLQALGMFSPMSRLDPPTATIPEPAHPAAAPGRHAAAGRAGP